MFCNYCVPMLESGDDALTVTAIHGVSGRLLFPRSSSNIAQRARDFIVICHENE